MLMVWCTTRQQPIVELKAPDTFAQLKDACELNNKLHQSEFLRFATLISAHPHDGCRQTLTACVRNIPSLT
ncbi:hypothetical protein L596_017516 [Steinernema carpocapsae]|uniref:Uncharacterized protein n=1 Tax=Steinernema carpocapsae TaxID=34508 RepID=A0A4U5N286_STECR|nr:hypothetical protein L596_017516 [Steinernema carpocapsae]